MRQRDRYNDPTRPRDDPKDPKLHPRFSPRKSLLAKRAGKCALCDGIEKHKESECPVFSAANVNQRLEIVKSKGVCFGCLEQGHQRRQCTAPKCGVDSCEKGHHKLPHAAPEQPAPKLPAADQTSKPQGVRCGKAQAKVHSQSKVALKTIVVPLVSDTGEIVSGAVLLDSGSETTLIRTGFAKQFS